MSADSICRECNGLGVLDERDEWGFGKPCRTCDGAGTVETYGEESLVLAGAAIPKGRVPGVPPDISADVAAIRESVSHIARGCRSSRSHNPEIYQQQIDAALDRLVAAHAWVGEINKALNEAVAALPGTAGDA